MYDQTKPGRYGGMYPDMFIRYATKTGGEWHHDTVHVAPSGVGLFALAVTPDSVPYVMITSLRSRKEYKSKQGELILADRGTTEWKSAAIDGRASLAPMDFTIDQTGFGHVVFQSSLGNTNSAPTMRYGRRWLRKGKAPNKTPPHVPLEAAQGAATSVR